MTSYASWPWVDQIVVRVDSAEPSELVDDVGAEVTAALDVDASDEAATIVEDGRDDDETDSTEALDVVAAASDVAVTEVEVDIG